MLTTTVEYRYYVQRRTLLALLLCRITSLADLLSSVWSLVGKRRGVFPRSPHKSAWAGGAWPWATSMPYAS